MFQWTAEEESGASSLDLQPVHLCKGFTSSVSARDELPSHKSHYEDTLLKISAKMILPFYLSSHIRIGS